MRLTAKRAEKLRKPGRYADGHNLVLQITNSGIKSWIFRYERNGRERQMGLGPVRDVTLAQARIAAQEARALLRKGIDPLDERRSQQSAKAAEATVTMDFQTAAKKYLAAHEGRWGNQKHAAQFMSSLRAYVFPIFGKLSVAEIDTALVLKALEQPHPHDPTKTLWRAVPETASRVRGRIEAVLDFATVRGWRRGENCARWRGFLDQVLPARSTIQRTRHHAALPFAELPAFMMALAERDAVAARALEFTILCAARTSETTGAVWDEVDLAEKIWTIPAERMKAKKPHRVPLSDAAVALLEALPREEGSPFLFIGPKPGGPLSNAAMAAVLSRMQRDDITVHGFRSCFRDWAAEQTNFPREICEAALAHTIAGTVERAYLRSDHLSKRRALMAAWSKFATTPPREDAKVVVSLTRSKNAA